MRLATAMIVMATLLAARTDADARQLIPPPASTAPTSAETDAANEAAAVEALSNLSRVKTQARWLSGGEVELPEAQRLAGHHGKVLVTGVLGVDGRLRWAMIKTSSGSPVLDSIAVSAALSAVFEPAKDADGKALSVPITIPQAFYNYRSAEPGGGLVRYTCRQFAADMDWWRATFPDRKWSDHELYTMIVGIAVLAKGNLAAGGAAGLKATLADVETRWVKSIETCRAKPEKRFADVMQPEGRAIDALSKASR